MHLPSVLSGRAVHYAICLATLRYLPVSDITVSSCRIRVGRDPFQDLVPARMQSDQWIQIEDESAYRSRGVNVRCGLHVSVMIEKK